MLFFNLLSTFECSDIPTFSVLMGRGNPQRVVLDGKPRRDDNHRPVRVSLGMPKAVKAVSLEPAQVNKVRPCGITNYGPPTVDESKTIVDLVIGVEGDKAAEAGDDYKWYILVKRSVDLCDIVKIEVDVKEAIRHNHHRFVMSFERERLPQCCVIQALAEPLVRTAPQLYGAAWETADHGLKWKHRQ